MLVLTRRQGESIWIGQEIQIKVLESSRSRICIGINAPPDIPILREELRKGEPVHGQN